MEGQAGALVPQATIDVYVFNIYDCDNASSSSVVPVNLSAKYQLIYTGIFFIFKDLSFKTKV